MERLYPITFIDRDIVPEDVPGEETDMNAIFQEDLRSFAEYVNV